MLAPVAPSTYTASQQLDRLSSELWLSIVVYIRTVNQYNVLLNAYKVHNKVYVQGIALQHDVSLFLRTPNVLTNLPSLGISLACSHRHQILPNTVPP